MAASVEPRKIFYFSVLDRHGWLDSGAAGLKFFYGETGSLFHAWVLDAFISEPDAFFLGESEIAGEGRLHSMALVCDADKTPWLWLYDSGCPSNAIVGPVRDGAVLSHRGELCSTSIYASYCAGSIQYDMSGFAVPYSEGEYSLEWVLPAQTNTDIRAMVAFTTTPGSEASFVAGGLRPTADLSEARNIARVTTGGDYHAFTSSPTDACCRFAARANADPTLSYSFRNSGSEPLRIRASISFDSRGDGDGWMRFTALPVAAVRGELRQLSTDGRPTTAATLELSLTSEGRMAAGELGGVRVTSPDPRVEAELARVLATWTSEGSPLVISDPAVIGSLRTAGEAALSLPPLRPDLSYDLAFHAVPSEGIMTEEWRGHNFGMSEEAMEASPTYRLTLPAPSLAATGERYETVLLTDEEARSLTTDANRPKGPVPALYTAATRIHHEFSLGKLAEVPEGWSAAIRLLDPEGRVIKESMGLTASITGLRPDTPRQLRAQAVYTSPDGAEALSETTWAPADILPAGMPTISVTAGQIIVQRSGQSGARPELGKVYDLVFEYVHEAINPHGLPFCVSLEVEADNTGEHAGHLVDGSSPQVRLMHSGETYTGNQPGQVIAGNEGVMADFGPEWSSALARNGRTALYLHHFHCESPGSSSPAAPARRVASAKAAEEAGVTARYTVHVPLLMAAAPEDGANAEGRGLRGTDSLLVLDNPNTTDGTTTATHTIPLTDLDRIATGTHSVHTPADEASSAIHDLQGRPLPAEPVRGFYLKGRQTFHR